MAKVSNIDAYSDAYDTEDEIYTTNVDDSSMTFQLSGGYRFDMGLGIDIGYLDLGEPQLKERTRYLDFDDRIEIDATYRLTFKPKGYVTGVNYQFDVNEWLSFSAKSGLFIWKMDVTAQTKESWGYGEFFESNRWGNSSNGIDLYYGVSAIFTVGNRLAFDTSASYYSFEFEDAKENHNALVSSIGMTYYFGDIPANSKRYSSRPRQEARKSVSSPVSKKSNSAATESNATPTPELGEEFSLLPEAQPAPPKPVVKSSQTNRSTQRHQNSRPGDTTACNSKYKHLFPLCD